MSVRGRIHAAVLGNPNQDELNENCSEMSVVKLRLDSTQGAVIASSPESFPRGLSLAGKKRYEVPHAIFLNRNFFLKEHRFVLTLARYAERRSSIQKSPLNISGLAAAASYVTAPEM